MVCSAVCDFDPPADNSAGNFELGANADCTIGNDTLAISAGRETSHGNNAVSGGSILYLHALPMTIAFILLLPLGALMIRLSFLLHVLCQLAAIVLLLFGCMPGVASVLANPSQVRLFEPHVVYAV